jgi:hypothetical protein
VFDLRQDIPIAARLTGAAVHAIDGEKLGPVCHRAAMMPRHAREGRAIFVAFHGLAYGPKCVRQAGTFLASLAIASVINQQSWEAG